MEEPKYNTGRTLYIDLSGPDGNAFFIMGRVVNIMRKAGAPEEEIENYRIESTSGDYENLKAVAKKYINVEFVDNSQELEY